MSAGSRMHLRAGNSHPNATNCDRHETDRSTVVTRTHEGGSDRQNDMTTTLFLRRSWIDRWQITVNVRGMRLSRVFHARNATEATRAADAVRIELQAARESVTDAKDIEREQRRGWTVERYIAYYFAEWSPYHLADTTRERIERSREGR